MTSRHRLVIVDDEPNIGLSLRLILEREGYAVTVCESAASFRAEYRPGRADLVLLDDSFKVHLTIAQGEIVFAG